MHRGPLKCTPKYRTMAHWGLDVHAVDRNNSSMLQLDCHVFQRGQAECHWACAHSILIISTLKHKKQPHCYKWWIAGDMGVTACQCSILCVRTNSKFCNENQSWFYLYILNYDRKVILWAVLCQQILALANEGEELVVKGLEVRLANNQALTYTETTRMWRQKWGLYSPDEHISECAEYYCTALSPGQSSLVHSHEPWRHTLQKRDICLKDAYIICSYFCVSISALALSPHHVLQSWEIVNPGGKCCPMCAQEHWDTSTQRLPSKTLPAETHMHAI